MIPEAAVEAAAKASFQFMEERPWTRVDPDEVDFFRDAARKALEAAAPHMLAAAWEEGAAAQAECYGMDKDTGPNPYAVGARRLVDINGRKHDAMCDRDRCHPDCPERLLRRALRR